jgi:DNA (cytosine-5)-methyltransferase 1
MRHGSLFSGIGGFDLAAEWMGWENVFHCEWMEFPRKVLDYHFPNADSHIDICKTDFTKYANTIDILTGGFPCQPFSLAGKRKGTDDERYLWGEMLRAIQEIKPRFVIAENVFGITNIDGGLVFQQVCLDLENEGYEVQPFIIPACAKNAPHRRDRCWFIATNTNCNDGRSTDRKGGCQESKANGEGQQSIHSRIGATSNEGHVANANSRGLEGAKEIRRDSINVERKSKFRNATNANGRGTQTRQVGKVLGQSDTQGETGGFVNDALQRNASYSNSNGLNERNGNDEINTSEGGEYALGHIGESNDNGNTSNTNGIRSIQRNTIAIGELSKRDGFEALCQSTNWENFPTQSPVCGGDDGLPTELDGITFPKWRAESIKGYGNAIVPQIAYQLFQIINDL